MAGDLEATIKHASSPSCADGRIEVNPLNGIPPYTYRWYNFNDPSQIIGTDNSIDNLLPGKYCVDVEDAYGGEVCGCWDVGVDNDIIRVVEILNPESCFNRSEKCYADRYGAIEIDVVSNQGYTILWSTAATTKRIENLTSGYYNVKVKLSNGCILTKDFNLCCCSMSIENNNLSPCKSCPTNNLQQFVSIDKTDIKKPTSANSKDGSIVLLVSGGISKLYYKWTGPNNFYSSSKDILNLGQGRYCVKITDGCSDVEKCFDLVACNPKDFVFNFNIQGVCPNDPDGGFIEYMSPYYSSYRWPNNEIFNFFRAQIGKYTVTISDPSFEGCEFEFTHEIKEAERVYAEITSIRPDCNNSNSGSISLEIYNNIFFDINNFYWEDLPHGQNGIFPKNRYGLKAGTYCVVLEDYCGKIRQCFDIKESNIEISAVTNVNCVNRTFIGGIDLTITGSNPPYQYAWSNGSISEDLINVPFGIYKVTVSNSVGCTQVKEFNLTPVEIIQITNACQGINDGSIKLKINNPNHLPVDVYYPVNWCQDCGLLSEIINNESDPIFLNQLKLRGNKTYSLNIWIGDCYFQYNFYIPEDPLTESFSKFISPTCFYNLSCKNELLIANGATKNPNLRVDEPCEPGDLFKDCPDMIVSCPGNPNPVQTIKGGTKWMRTLEIVEYTNKIGAYLHPSISGANPCDKWLVCDSDPNCTLLHQIEAFGGVFKGFDNLGNGCYRVKCRFLWLFNTSYIICDNNFIPEKYRKFLNPEKKTTLESSNICQLVNCLQGYIDKYPKFKETELYKKIIEWQNAKPSDLTLNCCGNVTYSIPEFKIITETVTKQECKPLPFTINKGFFTFTHTCGEIFHTNDGLFVWCFKCELKEGMTRGELEDCFEPIRIGDPIKGISCPIYLRGEDPSRSIIQTDGNSTFKSFTQIQNETEGYKWFNGIVSKSGLTYFYSFNPENFQNKSTQLNNIEYLSQEISTESATIITSTPESNVYVLSHGNHDNLKNLVLNSNEFLKIESQTISSSNGIINLNGKFKGILILNDSITARSNDTSLFYLTLNANDNTKRLNIFDSKSKIFRLNDSSKYLIYSQNFEESNMVIFSSIENNIINAPKIQQNYSVLNCIPTSNGYILHLNGTGELKVNNNVIVPNSEGSKNYLLKIENDNVIFVKDFSNFSIDKNKLILVSTEANELIVGWTEISANSNKNIMIQLIDNNGIDIQQWNFGSESDGEELIDLKYLNRYLFLGGNIYGNTQSRLIGQIEFIKAHNYNVSAFISYLDLNTSTISQRTTNGEKLKLQNKELTILNGTVFISFPENDEIRNHELINLQGQIVSKNKYSVVQSYGSQKYCLNLQQLPSGVYVIKLSGRKNYKTYKFVKP